MLVCDILYREMRKKIYSCKMVTANEPNFLSPKNFIEVTTGIWVRCYGEINDLKKTASPCPPSMGYSS